MTLLDGAAEDVGLADAGPGAAAEPLVVLVMINVRVTTRTAAAANTSPRRTQ
jgi:hypothetical protein